MFKIKELNTDEKYNAITKLYKMLGPSTKESFCKDLGIAREVLNNALDYCDFSEQEILT